MPTKQTYGERAASFTNPTAIKLLQIMERKKTNLCVSVDVTKKSHLLQLAKSLGPHICVLKTHIDIIEDFDLDLVKQLQALQVALDFLIFEDRKFADIGNTAQLQYSSGMYKISSWADITNAHPVPGAGVVAGLAAVGQPLNRGLLLLAEMSSKGSLAVGEYTEKALAMAEEHRGFVFGFIGQRRLTSTNDFVYMTPGVSLDENKNGSFGQQYRTPHEVICESGCDIIIVGRGIYSKGIAIENAIAYKKAGWDAYLARRKQ